MKEENKIGPKYHIDIEGTLFPWDEETITTEQIINLGGWATNQGAIMIEMATNIEVTLQPGQIIELKPGLGFSKKHKFKRG
jgi:hypothetical protein